MKTSNMAAIAIISVLVLFIVAFVTTSCKAEKKSDPVNEKGFAVLELFTSEGCSSCPPADALLARIQKEAGDKPVYILAYHVDYWNRLGWKDVFSNPLFTERQYQYSTQLSAQVYTPQLVVNGRSEYVGSDASAVNSAMEKALQDSAAVNLEINGHLQPGKTSLDYKISGNAGRSQLLVAVVQKEAVNNVLAGENGGRRLSHVQIVRDLQKFELGKNRKGSVQVNMPSGFNTKEWELISLIQNPHTGVIEAATRVTDQPGTTGL
jgi:hypothetical protein